MIDDTLVNTRSSPEDTLEYILFNTQTIAREHTQFKNCLKKSVRTFLENEIKITQRQIDSRSTPTPSLDIYITSLKNNCQNILKIRLLRRNLNTNYLTFPTLNHLPRSLMQTLPDHLLLLLKSSQ